MNLLKMSHHLFFRNSFCVLLRNIVMFYFYLQTYCSKTCIHSNYMHVMLACNEGCGTGSDLREKTGSDGSNGGGGKALMAWSLVEESFFAASLIKFYFYFLL